MANNDATLPEMVSRLRNIADWLERTPSLPAPTEVLVRGYDIEVNYYAEDLRPSNPALSSSSPEVQAALYRSIRSIIQATGNLGTWSFTHTGFICSPNPHFQIVIYCDNLPLTVAPRELIVLLASQ